LANLKEHAKVNLKTLRDKNERKLRKLILEFNDLVKETYWYIQGHKILDLAKNSGHRD